MRVKVVNHGPSPLVLRYDGARLPLEVGACEVDGDTLSAILAGNPSAKRVFALQCQLFTPQQEGSEEEAAGPRVKITKLKVAAALSLIEKCKDVDTLTRWNLEDSREEVKKALHLRWRALVPEDKTTL